MDEHLKVIDQIHLQSAALMEELSQSENKRALNLGEIVFNNVAKLADFEETYMKLNHLLYSLCLSNQRRGEAVIDLISRLKLQDAKIEEYERELLPERLRERALLELDNARQLNEQVANGRRSREVSKKFTLQKQDSKIDEQENEDDQ